MIPDPLLVQLSLEAYIAFFAFLGLIMVFLFWRLQKRDREVSDQFFGQFEHSELRMSPYKIGVVYRIVATEAHKVAVIPIWDGKLRITNGKEIRFECDELIPFDASRFSV